MKYLLTYILLAFSISTYGSHIVYLIHGHGSPKFVLNKIERNLNRAGFETKNYGYNSLYVELDELGKELYDDIEKSGYDSISFVTHSMGALVVRSMYKNLDSIEKHPVIFRIVMIAPPNKGAEIADIYAKSAFTKWVLGPNIELLKTDSSSYANNLPVPEDSEVGVIVGIKGDKYGYSLRIKGDDDGRLKPERTTMGIEKDVAVFHEEHTVLTQKRKVIKIILEFLKFGSFISKEG